MPTAIPRYRRRSGGFEIAAEDAPLPVDNYLQTGQWVFRRFITGAAEVTGLANERTSIFGNTDGAQSGIDGSIDAAISDYGRVVFLFYGHVLALAMDRGTCADFGVLIDGVAYRIEARYRNWDTHVLSTRPYSGYACVPVATDLEDGEHRCDIVFVGAAAGAKTATLWGYIVDGRNGVRTPNERAVAATPTLLTASAAVVNMGSSYGNYSGIRQIRFINRTGDGEALDPGAQVVRVYVSINAKLVVNRLLEPNEDTAWTLPCDTYNDGYIKAWASVANAILMAPMMGTG